MRRLGLGTIVLLCGALLWAAAAQGRIAVMKWGLQPERYQVLSVEDDGSGLHALFGKGRKVRPLPETTGGLSWFPQGDRIAFVGITGAVSSEEPDRSIYVVPSEGGAPVEVPGTRGALYPVVSPDGARIAFARQRLRYEHWGPARENFRLSYQSKSTWMVDLAGGAPRRLTPWRDGLAHVPSSFSPDGAYLALTRWVGERRPEALALGLAGQGSVLLQRNGAGPAYSPDGTRIAFLRGPTRTVRRKQGDGTGSTTTATLTDLFVKTLADGSVRRLTDTPATVEFEPSWDPSGTRFAYLAQSDVFGEAGFFGFGNALMTVNADGTCPAKVLSAPNWAIYSAAWQPGAVGEVPGPAAC